MASRLAEIDINIMRGVAIGEAVEGHQDDEFVREQLNQAADVQRGLQHGVESQGRAYIIVIGIGKLGERSQHQVEGVRILVSSCIQ